MREKHQSVASCMQHHLDWGPKPQPRHMPWLGIEPATFCFAGWCSTNWATLVRASLWFFFKISFIYLLRFYLFIFRERGREGEREGEKHQCVVASHTPPTGDLVHNPGMCPDWELNWWPLGSQAHAQSTEPHQPEQVYDVFNDLTILPYMIK